MSKKKAQETLYTTNSAEKNELLFSKFGINYNNLDQSFRKGSVIYRRLKQREVSVDHEVVDGAGKKGVGKKRGTELTVEHCDIIGDEFWNSVGRDLFSQGVKDDEGE
jgi:tRNA(His) guanylyltransferase